MKRVIIILIILAILTAAALLPEEAGEKDPNGPYIYIVDSEGNETRVQ